MNESKTRDKILKRIRQALLDKAPDPFPDVNFASKIEEYNEQEYPELLFAENFIAAGGHFTFCENEQELKAFLNYAVQQLKPGSIICSHPALKNFSEETSLAVTEHATSPADISISSCFSLTACPPSMILSSSSYFNPASHHIIVAVAQNTIHDLKQGLHKIKEAVRTDSENNFEIISFAESGNDENTIVFPAGNFFIAMIDWNL